MDFATAVRSALAQELARDSAVFIYGEGINDPSGFFGTTVGLAEEFGLDRCFDVPNSEETLAGFGVGAALGGMRPVFVNLRMEFVLLAANQLVNHAAKWSAMHGRTIALPLTVRAMVGRGWGQGAQHSGFYGPLFANVPGLQVGVASGPVQGAALVVAAIRGATPTLVIEPKAVYEMTEERPDHFEPAAVGRAALVRAGGDFGVVAIGDGVQTAVRAAEALEAEGLDVAVLDATWLAPFDGEAVRALARRTRRIGVVDIGWAPFGLAAEVARQVVTDDPTVLEGPLLSWAVDDHVPAGCFAEVGHYPTVDEIVQDIRKAASPSRS